MNEKIPKKTIIIFSDCFGYNVGGAEWYLLEILKEREREGYRICVVSLERLEHLPSSIRKMSLPPHWEVKTIRLRMLYLRWFLPFVYCLNKKNLTSYFKNLDSKCILYSYGRFAPAAINVFGGDTYYFINDEYGLGWNKIYETGWKFSKKAVRDIFNFCWQKLWYRDLMKCMKKSQVIALSRFLAKEAEKINNKKTKIIYPKIDLHKLQQRFQNIDSISEKDRGIVMVGDNRLKGSDIFRKIARHFPEEKFFIFGKQHVKPLNQGNITMMPWQSECAHVYKYAELLLVPSRWYEGFGMVTVEARSLGIPVIASNRGGIPEAMNYEREFLVDDLENISCWVEKIKSVLSQKENNADNTL